MGFGNWTLMAFRIRACLFSISLLSIIDTYLVSISFLGLVVGVDTLNVIRPHGRPLYAMGLSSFLDTPSFSL